MKTITPYLLKFTLTITVLTIIFRYFLSYGIEENNTSNIVTLSAVIYFFLMLGSGWYFGKMDGEYLPISDVGFRFHLVTYLIHNGISILWIMLGLGSKYETLNLSRTVAFYWGIFILFHFFLFLKKRKKTINSLDKEDLFE